MAYVTLRFLGRFMYATQKTSREIKAIAPRFDPSIHGQHTPMMTIRRDQLKFQERPQGPILTTLAPTSKVISDASPDQAELWIWDLSNRRITYDVKSKVALTGTDGVILDYPEIEQLAGNAAPVLDPSATTPAGGAQAKSNAVIDISGGVGVASRILKETLPHTFVKKKNVSVPNGNIKFPNGNDVQKTLADLVEFIVPMDAAGGAAKTVVTFTIFGSNGAQEGIVSVVGDTRVGFSHVCSRIALPNEVNDTEFLRYYNLLTPETTPSADEQVIPVEHTPGLIEGPDCTVAVAMEFE